MPRYDRFGEPLADDTDADREARAWEELLSARRHYEAVSRLVAAGKVGAASLHTAEYALHGALERVRALGLEPDEPENVA